MRMREKRMRTKMNLKRKETRKEWIKVCMGKINKNKNK